MKTQQTIKRPHLMASRVFEKKADSGKIFSTLDTIPSTCSSASSGHSFPTFTRDIKIKDQERDEVNQIYVSSTF